MAMLLSVHIGNISVAIKMASASMMADSDPANSLTLCHLGVRETPVDLHGSQSMRSAFSSFMLASGLMGLLGAARMTTKTTKTA